MDEHVVLSGLRKHTIYVPAKCFIRSTPWERSPEDFGPALETIEGAAWLKLRSPYHSLRQDSISQLTKEHKAHIKKAMAGHTDGTTPETIKIIDDIRNVVQRLMNRRTDDSYIHGHRVAVHPKITAEWAEFMTPSTLALRLNAFRKPVSKDEREAYHKGI